VLALGRDPYFAGWPDTLQLDYGNPATREAMAGELLRIAGQCDGVRCDMAMLVLPEVFERTWGIPSEPFWPEAIRRVRERVPDFCFMAEVYWDLEWTLQQQGFDYTYDKRLYDRLHGQDAAAVRGHLHADPEFQRRSVRFLENHDEPRAAAAFPPRVHRAAATIAFLVPGLRFVHEGQRSGRQLRASNHLRRRSPEPIDLELAAFYARLLGGAHRPVVRDGQWRLLPVRPAWDGNPTWDRFIAFAWELGDRHLLVAVNYGPTQGQCYVDPGWSGLDGRTWYLTDLLNPAVTYERDGGDLARRGLYLDLAAWGHHLFEVTPKG
jgi:hypothetical protein